MRWVLPDHIQDALPSEARQLETLRRRLLDAFRVRGYQLVMPPDPGRYAGMSVTAGL